MIARITSTSVRQSKTRIIVLQTNAVGIMADGASVSFTDAS
jgi:hypothetical protein